MRNLRHMAPVAASALVLLVGTTGAAHADADRPFKGTVAGLATFAYVGTAVCPALGLQTAGDATGIVNHLGATTMHSEHCTPTGAAITGGLMTLTAANGDKVYLDYEGVQLELPDFMGGTVGTGEAIPIEGTFEVAGGTGRFEDASGSGTWTASVVNEGLADPDWAGTWSYTGTIDR